MLGAGPGCWLEVKEDAEFVPPEQRHSAADSP